MRNFLVKRLHEDATIPFRAHGDDAGLDVYTIDGVLIPPYKDALVKTGFAMSLPEGFCAIVKEKSGRAVKNKITIGACVIDSGYRGEVLIHLFNNSDQSVIIAPGEAVAQILIVPVLLWNPMEVEELQPSKRMSGGFGSTGLKRDDEFGKFRSPYQPRPSKDDPYRDGC